MLTVYPAGFFRKSVLLLTLLCAYPLYAQQVLPRLWEENLEELLSESEDPSAWEDELEELDRIRQTSLNLNAATRDQLEMFSFLTDTQIENILAYLHIHGPMQTLYELQGVEDLDRTAIDRLLPFVCVAPVNDADQSFPSLRTLAKYGRHEVLTRLDVPFYTRRGYRTSYLGPKLYHSLRYGFRYGNYLEAGLTGEKDAGEPFFALHNRKGYDHYSYYLVLRGIGRLQTLVLGTYRLDFGQGLVLGNVFGLGKSFSLATTHTGGKGIRKHGSTDEYNYFRGVAAQVGVMPGLSASAFYSHRCMDGVVEEGAITSIDKAGLHRTQREADKADAFTLQLAGGNLTYEKNALKLGMTGIYYFFDRDYTPQLRTYAKYNLQGNRFYNVGMDYRYRLGRLSLTGEAAKGKHGYALLNRLQWDVGSGYHLQLVHRLYTHDYWAFFARSFGEGSTPQNENGWYMAAEAAPFDNWRFFGSLDFFSFPWWKYRISKPSQGWEGRFQATYTPSRTVSMYANYRYKRKERDETGTGGAVILPIHHHRLRYRFSYEPGTWMFRTTADYNHFHARNRQASQGWQCTQLCGYALPDTSLSVTLQGTYFCTDDYDSCVYAYEKGLLHTFYTPSFSGRGVRWSAHVRFDWGEHLMLLAKLGQTIYLDRDAIGSGNEWIAGKKKMDLQMQLRLKF